MDFFLQQVTNGVALGSVFALYALGFSLVLANLGTFHVGHAGVFTWGAVFVWFLTDRHGLPLAVAFPLVVALSGLLNVGCYFVALRHLERRRNNAMAGFISSLGVGIVLAGLALEALDGEAQRLPFSAFPVETWDLGPIRLSSIQLLIIGTAIASFLLLRWLVNRTQFGREVQSVAYDRETSTMLGVNVDRVSALVFFVSGALGGVGAVLVAVAYNVIDSRLGEVYLLVAITAVVVGGFGNVRGAFLGGLSIGVVSSMTTGYVTSSYRDVVVFGVLMLVLVIRPTGLFTSPATAERA